MTSVTASLSDFSFTQTSPYTPKPTSSSESVSDVNISKFEEVTLSPKTPTQRNLGPVFEAVALEMGPGKYGEGEEPDVSKPLGYPSVSYSAEKVNPHSPSLNATVVSQTPTSPTSLSDFSPTNSPVQQQISKVQIQSPFAIMTHTGLGHPTSPCSFRSLSPISPASSLSGLSIKSPVSTASGAGTEQKAPLTLLDSFV